MKKKIPSISNKKIKYRSIVLKISGETLGMKAAIFDRGTIARIVEQIAEVHDLGINIGLVVGGGNIIRGRTTPWLDKVDADLCGMIATMINGLVLHSELKKQGVVSHLRSAFEISGFIKPFDINEDAEIFGRGDVFIFAGGTGNPFFTTDTAAALRAAQLKADILIKGTKVEGVYSADPQKVAGAQFHRQLRFDEAIDNRLRVMDLTAFNICQEAGIPICVYNFFRHPLKKIIEGSRIGTLIKDGGKK